MAKKPENSKDTATAESPQVKMSVLTQYVRDLSFENILAQKGGDANIDPDIQVNVNLDAQKRSAENQFQVSIKLNVNAINKGDENSLFMLEVDYVGIFHIEGVPEDQLHPFLLIECPRNIFPFLRRVVSDVTRDGGFPPLNLETIDFVTLYRQQLAKMQEEAGKPS